MKGIILSVADDQRWDMIGAVGDRRVRTPHFDALAARGTAFCGARCQNGPHPAVCIPSRAALHTGRPVAEIPLDCGDFPTMGEVLREVGFVTHGVGKWHNQRASWQRSFTGGEAIFFEGMHDHIGMPLHPYDPSGRYDRPARCPKFSSEAFADAAIRFLANHPEDQPFFLSVAWTSPHDPRTPPPPFDSLYEAEHLDLPPNFLPAHPFDNGELAVRDELLAAHPRDAAEIRRHLAAYFGMVSELDAQWGRILQVLADRSWLDETLIIHTADHGLAVGQHGLMGKQNLYEHSVRVPLVIAGPGIPAGLKRAGLCYNFDIAPTILEWAGVARPSTMTARSLLPLAQTEAAGHPGLIAWYRDFQRSYTDGRWKIIQYRSEGTLRNQVFDLDSDPWETNDLSAAHPEIFSDLSQNLPPWGGGTF